MTNICKGEAFAARFRVIRDHHPANASPQRSPRLRLEQVMAEEIKELREMLK